MISGISNTSYAPPTATSVEPKQRPSQLPAGPGEVIPPSSEDAAKLRAARALTENPIAVAAVTDNAQVDEVANNVYISQQARELLNTYSNSTDNALGNDSNGTSNDEDGAPLAIAAVSDNPDVDELATTISASRQALQAVDNYQNIFSGATSQQTSSVDDEA